MKSPFKPFILIPHYNHSTTLVEVINHLKTFNLPILVIDDGSNDEDQSRLSELEKQDTVFVVYRAENGGKGAAVKQGLIEGLNRGFSHAIQVDADGQHHLADLSEMLEKSQQYPDALICGKPVYGEDAPKSRLYGRKITNFWISVNTLSMDIADGMCGFRIYPLTPTVAVIQQKKLGDRMEFDTEILVYLHWQKVPMIWVNTLVKYTPNGISHFRAWQDNWLISKMHARLFFSMLMRIFTRKNA